jgi:hypothetical protein
VRARARRRQCPAKLRHVLQVKAAVSAVTAHRRVELVIRAVGGTADPELDAAVPEACATAFRARGGRASKVH